ncbi:hypothetical protein BD410DRAFT_893774 [Rickenella mellea]|uniref:Uncharacterized protein n=1 Tax=Rickenella mellea TaxID=50990 RepID=A0A4Y7QMH7_9AGAM|nr:hypothetical protein BD410DRAFT_893774 [Rickenella mellea]
MENSNEHNQRRPAPSRPSSVASRRPLLAPEHANVEVNDPAQNSVTDPRDLEPSLAETRSNLIMASTALEAAITRLQLIRSSLRELDVRGGRLREVTTASRPTVGPNHSAIVLAGEEHTAQVRGATDLEQIEATLPSAIQSMLRIVRSNQGRDATNLDAENINLGRLQERVDVLESFSNALTSGAPPATRRRLQFPPIPSLPPALGGHNPAQHRTMPRRRSLLEMNLLRSTNRPESTDDSFTSLGRRVAARAAAIRTSLTSRRADPQRIPEGGFSGEDEGSITTVAGNDRPFAWENSLMLRGVQARPSEPQSPGTDSDVSATTIEARSSIAFPGSATLPGGASFPSLHALRASRSSTSQTTAQNRRARSIERGTNGGVEYPGPVFEPDTAQRSYRVRRRLNSDGEEFVHQISTEDWWDDDEDPSDWLVSPVPRERLRATSISAVRMRRTADSGAAMHRWIPSATPVGRVRPSTAVGREPPQSSAVSNTENTIQNRRRRGWARLNADGDEIPTDEEEEIERNRSTQRRSRVSDSLRPDGVAARRARLEYLVPAVRSASSTTDGDFRFEARGDTNFTSGRMISTADGMRPRCPRHGMGGVGGGVEERKWFGTDEPYYVDPLPMALDEMVPTPAEWQVVGGRSWVSRCGGGAAR